MKICGTESCNNQVQVEGGFCRSCLSGASKNTKNRQKDNAVERPELIEYKTSTENLYRGPDKPYKDLRRLASAIMFFASILKFFGYFLQVVLLFAVVWGEEFKFGEVETLVLTVLINLVCGLLIYIIALIISASGEALLALADIALYTSRIPKPKAVSS